MILAIVGFAEYSLFFAIILLSGFIHGSVGYGFALISAPLLSFIIPLRMTVAVTVFYIFGYTLHIVYRFREQIPWRSIFLPLFVSFGARVLGVFLLMNLDLEIIRLIWGMFLISVALYFMLSVQKTRIKPSAIGGVAAGFVTGVFSGLFNSGGPAMAIYFYNVFSDKRRYSAALQVTFMLGALVNLFVHLAYGNITLDVLRFAGIGVPVVFAGTFLGVRVFERLSKKHLNILVYLFMAVTGVIQIIKAIS